MGMEWIYEPHKDLLIIFHACLLASICHVVCRSGGYRYNGMRPPAGFAEGAARKVCAGCFEFELGLLARPRAVLPLAITAKYLDPVCI